MTLNALVVNEPKDFYSDNPEDSQAQQDFMVYSTSASGLCGQTLLIYISW